MATKYWVVIGSLPAMPGTSWDRHFTGRDAEKILVPPLPSTMGYETWRFQAEAAVMAASAKPVLCMQWLRQVQDPGVPFAHLAACDPQFQALDCRLFTGLLACLGGKTATNAEQEIALMAYVLRAWLWPAALACH